jgi:hypothetical protein
MPHPLSDPRCLAISDETKTGRAGPKEMKQQTLDLTFVKNKIN